MKLFLAGILVRGFFLLEFLVGICLSLVFFTFACSLSSRLVSLVSIRFSSVLVYQGLSFSRQFSLVADSDVIFEIQHNIATVKNNARAFLSYPLNFKGDIDINGRGFLRFKSYGWTKFAGSIFLSVGEYRERISTSVGFGKITTSF